MTTNSKKLSDYRKCDFFTKAQLVKIANKCGEHEVNEKMSKADLVKAVKEAQQSVINRLGQLYEGEY